MRKLKRGVERHKKAQKLLGSAAMLLMAAGLVFSDTVPKVYAGFSDTGYYAELNQNYANAEVINLNTIEIKNGKIEKMIDKSGAYILTGSNLRNGAYIDTCITVESGVTADLYLDNLNIVNDDLPEIVNASSSIIVTPNGVVPFKIYGVANICINSNSSIYTMNESFYVNGAGEINFLKSVNDAKLTVGLSGFPTQIGFETPLIDGYGTVAFLGANVDFTLKDKAGNKSVKNENYRIYAKVYLGKPGFSFGDRICFACSIITDLYQVDENNQFTISYYYGAEDINKNGLEYIGLCDMTSRLQFPANAEIIQIDDKAVSGIKTNNIGELRNCFLPSNNPVLYIKNGESCYYYQMVVLGDYNGSSASLKESGLAYSVEFKDSQTGELLKRYYIKPNNTVSLLPESNQYNYYYHFDSEDGEEVTADSKISKDSTIIVTKQEKDKFYLTIDGVKKEATYGDTLASLGVDKQLTVDIDNGKIYYPDTMLEKTVNLRTVKLDYEIIDGNLWANLNNAEDLTEYATIINDYKVVNINGKLNADVTLDNSFPMIGVSDGFTGQFDGQGHTVTFDNYVSENSEWTGFFAKTSAVSLIKNVNIAGSISGSNYVGGLIGYLVTSDGTLKIYNCNNYAEVSSSIATGYDVSVGGILGGNLSSRLIIKNCANYGKISLKAEHDASRTFLGGIVGICARQESTIENCINTDDLYLFTNNYWYSSPRSVNSYSIRHTDSSYEKPFEAFKSGEVAYLINNTADEQIWLQTCGEGLPTLKGDASTQTVYAGFSDCTSTDYSYANTPFIHTEQGHKDKAEAYSFIDGNFVAECMYCDEDIIATLNIEDEKLGTELKGVTVSYSDEWKQLGCPDVKITYSSAEDGVYSETKPVEVGSWYVKASVGEAEKELIVNGKYDIKYNCHAEDNVISILYCIDDNCIEHTTDKILTLTLGVDNDKVDYAKGECEKFSEIMGEDAPQIEYYAVGVKLDKEPEKPGIYTAKATFEYDGESYTAEIDYTIEKKTQAAPLGLTSVAPGSINGADGKILGVTSEMEYSVDNGISWVAVSGTEINRLNAGSVLVRFMENDYYLATDSVSVTVAEHTHTKGQYHTEVPGTCLNESQIEYWDCASNTCNEKIDASFNVISDIKNGLDADNHEKSTYTWVQTENTHQQIFDCCGEVKIAESEHVYGNDGDARFTCSECGYVSEDKKLAAEEADKAKNEETTGNEGNGSEGSGSESTGNEGSGNEGGVTENTGSESTGNESTGNEGSGTENTGSESTGNESAGNEGSGTENTGNESTGNEGSGTENTGSESTGNEGSETENTGSESTGNEVSGTENTGNESTGNEGSGTENTGSESTGNEGAGNEGSETENTGSESTGNEGAGNEGSETENTGSESTGNESAGNEGSGTENTGSESTGNEGSETENTGSESTGNEGSGTENTGSESTGNEGSGTENTGSESTGNESAGNEGNVTENTGSESTGNENTGNVNTGTENTGNVPSGNINIGNGYIISVNTGVTDKVDKPDVVDNADNSDKKDSIDKDDKKNQTDSNTSDKKDDIDKDDKKNQTDSNTSDKKEDSSSEEKKDNGITKEEQQAKVEQKVEAVKEIFDDVVKVVGATADIKEAKSGNKVNGVFCTSDGKKISNSFVTDDSGKTYYTGKNGKPIKKAIVTDGSKCYYCGKQGNIVKNAAVTLEDGKRMLTSKTGAIITKSNAKVLVGEKYYLTSKNGVAACKQVIKAKDGNKYYANKYGVMITNKTITVNGKKYRADENGVLKRIKK